MSPRAARAKGGAGVGCILFLAIGVPIIVAIGAVVLAARSGSSGTETTIEGVVGTDLSPGSGDLLVLPGDLADDPRVVTLATPIGDDRRVVALVDLEDGPVWQAEVVPDDIYSAQFAVTDDVVMASLGRGVIGLDRDDGTVLWEGEASDVVNPVCSRCFTVVGDTLVVLGSDGEITAFAADTGEVRWSHRFTSPSGRFVVVGEDVLLVDDAPEDDDAAAVSMILLDPADGSVLSELAPSCLDETGYRQWATPSLPVIPIPGTEDVVIAYGTSTGCVQRWTVTTGEQRWSHTTDARLDWYDADDAPWAIGDTELVLAGYEEWLVVGLSEGGLRAVPVPADTQAGPQVVLDGDRFVGTTSSTRGSTEWSLAAFDLRSGSQLWTHALDVEAAPAAVGPDSSTESIYDHPVFALVRAGDSLRLLTVGPPGPRFVVDGIDGDTGAVDRVGVAPVRSESPQSVSARIDTVRDGQVLVDADGVLQVVDLGTGAVGAAWGR